MGTWRSLDVEGAAAEARAHGIVAEALTAGVRLVDSSPMYGRSERVLAAGLGERRAEAIVATKVWTPDREEGERQMRHAIELYGGRVDLFQVHNLVSWRAHLPGLERRQDRGQVRALGATHYRPEHFPELAELMRSGRITAVQVPYNPHEQEVEREILPLAAELDIGVIAMRPLGSGPLVARSPPSKQLEFLAEAGITTWAQALLKWALSDPRVHAVIPASSRPGRMTENAAAGRPPWLDADQRERVAALAG